MFRRTQFEALLYEDSTDDEEVPPADIPAASLEPDPAVTPTVNVNNKIPSSESSSEDRENVGI